MELTDAIMARRSVRRYQDKAVPRELLEELLTVACWAPSAENTQPWYFVALTRPEELQKMTDTMEQVSESLRPFLEKRFPRHPRIVGETTGFLRRLGGAPVCILAFLQEEYEFARDSMVESVAAAIQNLLLAAHEKGLGACWVNAATELGYGDALRQQFAPDKGELVSIVTLGYPERNGRAPARKPDRWEIR